jgi:hypothetical protein
LEVPGHTAIGIAVILRGQLEMDAHLADPGTQHKTARHAATCADCGCTIVLKHTGRKPQYCSARCRDAHRRQLNFDFCGTTRAAVTKPARYPCQAKPRNTKNSPAISSVCKPSLAGRASIGKALWRNIVEVEVFAGRDRREVTSSDGVKSEVTMLRPRALREVAP